MEDFLMLDLDHRSFLYWNPEPKTFLKGIRRLLATQLLYLEKGEPRIEYRDTINKRDFSMLSPEEIYMEIFEQQRKILEQILKKYNKFNIALTAGYDSRLQLAILVKGNIPCSCHTFERLKSIANADNKVAPMIAKRLGLDYKFITLKHGIDVGRIMNYSKHTFNNVRDMDYKWHYSHHQYDDNIDFIMDDLKKLYVTLKGNTGAEESLLEYCQ